MQAKRSPAEEEHTIWSFFCTTSTRRKWKSIFYLPATCFYKSIYMFFSPLNEPVCFFYAYCFLPVCESRPAVTHVHVSACSWSKDTNPLSVNSPKNFAQNNCLYQYILRDDRWYFFTSFTWDGLLVFAPQQLCWASDNIVTATWLNQNCVLKFCGKKQDKCFCR